MDWSAQSDDQLLILLQRAVMLLHKPDWVERADEAIATIQTEFVQRQRLHLTRDYVPMLGALGYHVWQHGWKHTERRRLLLWIVDGELPTLNGDRYTRAWGRPGSLRRIKRMYDDMPGSMAPAPGWR